MAKATLTPNRNTSDPQYVEQQMSHNCPLNQVGFPSQVPPAQPKPGLYIHGQPAALPCHPPYHDCAMQGKPSTPHAKNDPGLPVLFSQTAKPKRVVYMFFLRNFIVFALFSLCGLPSKVWLWWLALVSLNKCSFYGSIELEAAEFSFRHDAGSHESRRTRFPRAEVPGQMFREKPPETASDMLPCLCW